VDPAGPAAAGGVRGGDVIVRLNGQGVRSVDEIHRILGEEEFGAQLTLEILRGGELLKIRVVHVESAP